MVDSPITLIAYGSLMSGLGLSGLGQLSVTQAAPMRVRNARRGFGKLSQYGDRYAMVLEPLRVQEPIMVTSNRQGDGLDALALTLSLNDFARVAVREGYQAAAVFALAEWAAKEGATLPDHLWRVSEAVDFDPARYRGVLFDAIGYTSPHYIPHPVAMSDAAPVLTFLAPGAEGSGNAEVVPIRVQTGMTRVLSLIEAWRLKPNSSQLDYFTMCLLAEAHDLSLVDVLDGIDGDVQLREALRARLANRLPVEPQQFCAVLGLSEGTYHAQFGGRPFRCGI